jgi:transcriptional regulator with XRE-family HTH domain
MTAKAPPRVGIRAVREAYGLTIPDLVTRIEEHGVTVKDTATIRNVETGNKRPSLRLLNAWAKALKLNPTDVAMPDECCCHEPHADAA